MSVPAFEAGALFTTLDIIMIDIGAPETSREKVCNAKNVDLMIPNTKLFVRSLRARARPSRRLSRPQPIRPMTPLMETSAAAPNGGDRLDAAIG
jgi:hypothetical protein